MVYVIRQTPFNQLPFPICVYTDLASTCVETYGSNMSFLVPGSFLRGLGVGDSLVANPFVDVGIPTPLIQPYIPGQQLTPYGYGGFDPNGVIILVETEDGDTFYHHERNRWLRRRVRSIIIADSSYNPLLFSSGIGRRRCGGRRREFGYGIDDEVPFL